MSLFKQRRPRPFHHELVYASERRDRLRRIEEQARRELGFDGSPAESGQSDKNAADRLHGVFLSATKHTSRRSQQRGTLSRFNVVLLLLLLVIAIVVMWTVATG